MKEKEIKAFAPIPPGHVWRGTVRGNTFDLTAAFTNCTDRPIRVFGKVKVMQDGENIILKIRKEPKHAEGVEGIIDG